MYRNHSAPGDLSLPGYPSEPRWGATQTLDATLLEPDSPRLLTGRPASGGSGFGTLHGSTIGASSSSMLLTKKRRSGVWRCAADNVLSPLPPLAKGASRHRTPAVDKKSKSQVAVTTDRILCDWEVAESYGRRILGDGRWWERVFEVADGSSSGYLQPAEFAAVAKRLGGELIFAADRPKGSFRFSFTFADSSMEGRVNFEEFENFAKQAEEYYGAERCTRAACRYLGTRHGEVRTKVKNICMFDGYSVEASKSLLGVCHENGNSALLDRVRSALEQKADPNVALVDKRHNGYTPLIWLAMALPTVKGEQVAQSIQALIEARADPHRESGESVFGKLVPLRFAAQLQNRKGLDALLKHVDVGDRFLWAAGENVEHVMLEELRKNFDNETAKHVANLSRYSAQATVLLRLFASPFVGGGLSPVGATQLLNGEYTGGFLPPNARADPDGPGLEGMTALMQVVKSGQLDTTRAILAGRANPGQKDSSGATPLHFAASWLMPDVARALLEAGAEPGEVDHAGLSAWMVVGEDLSHVQGPDLHFRPRKDGKCGDPDKRNQLLGMLRPELTPEEILERLEDPEQRAEILKDGSSPEKLTKRLRLHESLFYNPRIVTMGAYQGRNVQNHYLHRVGNLIIELISTDPLKGDEKNLAKYLLMASMGPDSRNGCAHVHTPWPVEDNRGCYRERLMETVHGMLDKFGVDCDKMRKKIYKTASAEEGGPCALLKALPADVVRVPQEWQKKSAFWRTVQERQVLRYDPSWAIEVDGSPTKCALALLRLGACADLAECSGLQQVHHAPMSELMARGYIEYTNLCNEAFQRRMHEVAARVAERENVEVLPPKHLVAAKKLKRLMEKTNEAQLERGLQEWPGLSPDYIMHGHCFHILDTVRLSFTCGGDGVAEQVACCMKVLDEFAALTPEKDGICLLRQKSGFAPDQKGAGGYADVKLLCYADLGVHKCFDGAEIPLRIVGEIQLILKGYMEVKNRMHLTYEVARGSFDRKR
mmetsp:Transcript_42608/g.110086  ORF Transcript_42608/g.110086 Transcript_42608/m.110086 type:complete len:997 (-) Transcript_42608:274-3264(-)